jgi:hypothetical protein
VSAVQGEGKVAAKLLEGRFVTVEVSVNRCTAKFVLNVKSVTVGTV